jgi:hypothetical protein
MRSPSAEKAPVRWGLHAFEPSDASGPEARPLWRSNVHPRVLGVDASDQRGRDTFDLEGLSAATTLVKSRDGREHLLISNGLYMIRSDVLARSVANGPVELRYRLAGLASVEPPLLTLRRLIALWRTGRFCRSLHPMEAKARRWVLMLRAHDALVSGASRRAIAAELLGRSAAEPRWRIEEPTLHSRAQRLVRAARAAASGGFWNLLQ